MKEKSLLKRCVLTLADLLELLIIVHGGFAGEGGAVSVKRPLDRVNVPVVVNWLVRAVCSGSQDPFDELSVSQRASVVCSE